MPEQKSDRVIGAVPTFINKSGTEYAGSYTETAHTYINDKGTPPQILVDVRRTPAHIKFVDDEEIKSYASVLDKSESSQSGKKTINDGLKFNGSEDKSINLGIYNYRIVRVQGNDDYNDTHAKYQLVRYNPFTKKYDVAVSGFEVPQSEEIQKFELRFANQIDVDNAIYEDVRLYDPYLDLTVDTINDRKDVHHYISLRPIVEIAFAETARQINEEQNERIKADTALATSIDHTAKELNSSRSEIGNQLTTEIERATTSEAHLQNSIQDEANRATQAETTLAQNLAKESADRETAQSQIEEQLSDISEHLKRSDTESLTRDNTLEQKLQQEVNRATGVEQGLSEAIKAEQDRASEAESSVQSDLISEMQIRAVMDNNISMKLDTEISNREQAVRTETQRASAAEHQELERATAAEQALQQSITNEATTRSDADKALDEAIAAEHDRAVTAEQQEYNRAIDAEALLSEAIQAESDRAKTAEKDLTANLQTEVNRATGVEQGLANSISQLNTDLSTDLSAEVERAKTAEKTLTDNLSTEVNRAKQAEKDLKDLCDTKLTKVTDTNELERVYTITPSGTQSTRQTSTEAKNNTVAVRTSQGTVKVAKPTADDDATTKKYVDSADSKLTEAVGKAQATADEAKRIAEGRAKAVTFDTFDDMVAALRASTASTDFKVGDNLFIRATEVPDYWISAVHDDKTQGQYGFYDISILETQKVDLSNHYTKTETDAIVLLETERATKKEEELSGLLLGEVERATDAEKGLNDALSQEVQARIDGDKALDEAVKGEHDRATQVETALAEALQAEHDRAVQAEADIESDLTTESERSIAEDNKLWKAISNKVIVSANEPTLNEGESCLWCESLQSFIRTMVVAYETESEIVQVEVPLCSIKYAPLSPTSTVV